MNLLTDNISHKNVESELLKSFELKKIKSSFMGMYCLKNFSERDVYILFRKIGYAYRRDPEEYRVQIPDLKLSEYLQSNNIDVENFLLIGFCKLKNYDEITLSIFNRIGQKASNRSYYVNMKSIVKANINGKSSWFNAEGFEVITFKSSLIIDELALRYKNKLMT
tara:strand:+ start:235 stop:729 length:495 start_codon:yes stop_codon:yes gene_type:complete